jgi:hypothetical protein
MFRTVEPEAGGTSLAVPPIGSCAETDAAVIQINSHMVLHSRAITPPLRQSPIVSFVHNVA